MIDRHRQLIDAARQQWEAARDSSNRQSQPSSFAPPDAADSIPGYRLEHLVHRGGQGAVYRAVQVSTHRTVALKIMRGRSFPSGAERARFEREVQILGELDHPSIVRVVDSGSAHGRDFLVMDFVDGAPIDRAGDDPRRLLERFAEVCDAVHAAHLRGVIHRDLKPGNILVDSQGRPHLVDFGLAKHSTIGAGDPAGVDAVTETGQFLGSLPWASPEQVSGARGGVDLRSDVYSLGVILYQLLTGEFPYRVTGAIGEITRNIQSAAPRAPSAINPEVDDELETIVLKSLSKEPERRYQSAGDLARDVRHLLAGEVIEAKRASLRYVLGKHLRRHWFAVSAAALLAVVVIGLAIVSTSLWRRAASERDLKESQRLRAESIRGVLHRILASASPERGRGRERTVVEALDEAVAELESGSLLALPEVEASVRLTIAESYLALGGLDETRRQIDRAVALLDAVPSPRDTERARALVVLGRMSMIAGDYAREVEQLESALAILRPLGIPRLGDSSPHPQDQIPAIATMLAGALARIDEDDRADAANREALDYATRRYGPDHPETKRTRIAIRTLRHSETEAIELLEEELALDGETLGPRHPATFRALVRLAAALHLKGRLDESEHRYLEALELGRSIYGERHPDLIRLVADLEWLYAHSKQFDKSVSILREWRPAARATYGPRGIRYAEFIMNLGSAMIAAHDPDAEATLREALALLESIGRDQSWQGAECRIRLGWVLLARTRSGAEDVQDPRESPARGDAAAEAERLAREALAITVDEYGSLELRHAHAKVLLGDILIRRSAFEEAESMLLEAYAVLGARGSMPHLRWDAANLLARLYGRWEEAEPGSGRSALAESWREKRDSSPP